MGPDPARRLDFYVGAHRPGWLETSPVPLCVAFHHLYARKRVGDAMPKAHGLWVLDSGAFTELQKHGEWRLDPDTYGGAVTRLIDDCGRPPQWVAIQDWMCEPWVISGGVHNGIRFAGTGLTVELHQELTVMSYVYLAREFYFVPWLPVLQGWTLQDYLRCVDMYAAAGVDLTEAPIVGLGSVCRRQNTSEIGTIVAALAARGLRLHGFGIKAQGLRQYAHLLASADSMAWSIDARWAKSATRTPACRHEGPRCNNCLLYAVGWRDRLLESLRPPGSPWSNLSGSVQGNPVVHAGRLPSMKQEPLTVRSGIPVLQGGEDVKTDQPDWWGVAEAADHCHVTPATWRSYVARGMAPAPDDPDAGSAPNRRRPRWRADTVRTWHAARPGKGGRPRKDTPTCWESRDSRATLGGISATWPRAGDGTLTVCWDTAPCPDAVCSRETGHAGRHMASLGPWYGHRIVAAWPGTHRPVKTDL